MSSHAGSMLAIGRHERLVAASMFEGTGRIINEWYTKAEYTTRRLGFLSRLDEYKAIPKLLPLVKADADEVFALGQSTLSAQRVRLRELDCAIDPLLPLVTSENTQTLDDFRAYPTSEWTPEMQIGTHGVFPSSPYQEAGETMLGPRLPRVQTTATASGTAQPPETTSSTHDPDSPGSRTRRSTSTNQGYSTMSTLLTSSVSSHGFDEAGQDNTTTQPGGSLAKQTTNNATSKPAPGDIRDASTDPIEAITPPSLRNPPARALLGQVLKDLAKPPRELWTSQPPTYAAEDGIAAVAGRPIYVAVKPQSRGTKHAAEDVEEAIDDGDDAFSTAPPIVSGEWPPNKRGQKDGETAIVAADSGRPAGKRIKINVSDKPSRGTKRKVKDDEDDATVDHDRNPRKRARRTGPEPSSRLRLSSPAVTETTSATEDSAALSPPPKRKTKSAPAKPTIKRQPPGAVSKTKPAPRPKRTRSAPAATPAPTPTPPAATDTEQDPVLARIARGARLPRSRSEATAAQAVRRQTLLVALSKAKPRARHPDLMPEFWEARNAKHTEDAEEGLVRCVCGATADDGSEGAEWIRCANGACGNSWQHVGCLGADGEAVSLDPAEREEDEYVYECHMCDPFRHRRVLLAVRKRK